MSDATTRFSSRVENYVRYRPHYPADVLTCLQDGYGLRPTSTIVDVGSGTGILTALFLENGSPVFGVEPNGEMRAAGERLLARFPRFRSVPGTAEATTLSAAVADFVTAGQAFHWFELARARAEFQRILRPGGWVVLVWNDRSETSSPFAEAYETLLRTYGTDYKQVNHKRFDAQTFGAFFGGDFDVHQFPNHQSFDFAGLKGRLLSSSYAPDAGHPQHLPMLAELERIFAAHATAGRVTFAYDTKLYVGQLQ